MTDKRYHLLMAEPRLLSKSWFSSPNRNPSPTGPPNSFTTLPHTSYLLMMAHAASSLTVPPPLLHFFPVVVISRSGISQSCGNRHVQQMPEGSPPFAIS